MGKDVNGTEMLERNVLLIPKIPALPQMWHLSHLERNVTKPAFGLAKPIQSSEVVNEVTGAA